MLEERLTSLSFLYIANITKLLLYKEVIKEYSTKNAAEESITAVC